MISFFLRSWFCFLFLIYSKTNKMSSEDYALNGNTKELLKDTEIFILTF